MPSPFIDDSYTLTGTIDAKPGLWDTITFRYRPALPEKVYQYFATARNNGKQTLDSVCKLLEGQLNEWDAVDDSGNVASISEANLKRLPHPILEQLVDAVCGYTPAESDDDVKN